MHRTMGRVKLAEAKERHNVDIIAQKNILTLEETMVWYDLSYEGLKELMNDYSFPSTKLGGGFRFCKQSIDSFFSSRMSV